MYDHNCKFLRFSNKITCFNRILTLVCHNSCLSPSGLQYILLAAAIASVKVSFRGTCNIYRGERSGANANGCEGIVSYRFRQA